MDEHERLSQLQREHDRWQTNTLDPSMARTPERRQQFHTASDIEVKRLYTPLDLAQHDYLERIGFPGCYPYTRGVRPTMYRSRPWTMRQYAGYGVAEETNRRFHFLLEQGETGLSVAFDLPTQLGYDADNPMAAGEVGKVGVAIDSLVDMDTLLQGIPLDRVSISMTINATAAILLAMYLAVARRQGIAPGQLAGTIQNDILKEYIARGTYIFPPGPSMRLVTDAVAYCTAHLPRWNAISVSGYHIREAGSTAVQEVAFALADGIAYVEAAVAAGLDVDRVASQLSFFFNAHSDLFEEIAKFRAARRLWATIMRRRCGARDPRSWMLRFHAQTSGVSLTAQQAENNLVRVALQAMAAALGGVQSLHTDSRDEALGLPTEDAARLAIRTQQIIAHESGVVNTIDPLGGSYYLETLTDRIEQEATAYIERIDAMGGMLRAIEVGFVQHEIQEAAYREQRATEERQRIVVGVNACTTAEPVHIPVFAVDPRLEMDQRAKLDQLRRSRDQGRVELALDLLDEAARGSANLLPPILEAVEAYATIGEICTVLRRVFGEHHGS
jgi:methylmalonyl-CoA mutase N-terminal domain/subunit